MKNKNNNLKNGFVNLIAMIILAAIVLGGGTYLVTKKSPDQKAVEVQNTVGDIGASIPSLDFSASPLPDLNVSALNVAAPSPKTSNIFSAPSINTDFSYKANLDIKTPSVSASDFNFTMPTIPTGNQQSAPTAPSGANEPSVDCSMFASVPSCSMTGPGEAMCKKCFPNK